MITYYELWAIVFSPNFSPNLNRYIDRFNRWLRLLWCRFFQPRQNNVMYSTIFRHMRVSEQCFMISGHSFENKSYKKTRFFVYDLFQHEVKLICLEKKKNVYITGINIIIKTFLPFTQRRLDSENLISKEKICNWNEFSSAL